MEYGYVPLSTGGNTGKVGLTAEYEHIEQSLRRTSDDTETTETRDETFKADPGTIQFRILVGSGTVASQNYRSTLQGALFTATYASSSADLNPREITFEADKPDDAKWNRSVAKPFLAARGRANYEDMVKRLKDFNCLKDPFTAAEAARQR